MHTNSLFQSFAQFYQKTSHFIKTQDFLGLEHFLLFIDYILIIIFKPFAGCDEVCLKLNCSSGTTLVCLKFDRKIIKWNQLGV